MEKPENKYQRGKIYKLISNQTDDVYYGSTIEVVLTNRLSGHRKGYKRWLNGKSDYVTSFEIVKFEDCKIILIEEYSCANKYQLTAREQYYIDNNKCVNKYKTPTGLTKSEYKKKYNNEFKKDLEQYFKNYYEKNKDKIHEKQNQYYKVNNCEILQKHKQYYSDNKEKVLERHKHYNQNPKNNISQQRKQYYNDNKEKLNQKINCMCGGKYTYNDRSRHSKTLKHQAYLKSLEDNKNDNAI